MDIPTFLILGFKTNQIAKNFFKQNFNHINSHTRTDKIMSVLSVIKNNYDPNEKLTLSQIAELASKEKYHQLSEGSNQITCAQVSGYLNILLNEEKKEQEIDTTSGYFLYKYVENNEIIYIGKTINLNERIYSHTRDKLKNFQGKIYYIQLKRKDDMDHLEYVLINKYHPKYNIQYNNPDIHTDYQEPIWKEWED